MGVCLTWRCSPSMDKFPHLSTVWTWLFYACRNVAPSDRFLVAAMAYSFTTFVQFDLFAPPQMETHNLPILCSVDFIIALCLLPRLCVFTCVRVFAYLPFGRSVPIHVCLCTYLSIRVLLSAHAHTHTPIYSTRFLSLFVHVYVSVTGYLLYSCLVYIRFSFLGILSVHLIISNLV